MSKQRFVLNSRSGEVFSLDRLTAVELFSRPDESQMTGTVWCHVTVSGGSRVLTMHFRAVKNAIALPLHRFGTLLARLPKRAGRGLMAGIGALGRAGYFIPRSHIRQTVENFCRATGRADPWPIYSRMVDNVEQAALHYAYLHRYGRGELLEQSVLDPIFETEYRRLGEGERGVIILVPHCIAAVLSSARLNTFCPTVLLVREPSDPARCELMLAYVRKLGPEFILTRNTAPAVVMRNLVRALRDHKTVVGTVDLPAPDPDTIETRSFGQRIYSPAWPARLSARLGAPIVPAYIHMDGLQIRLIADEGYVEPDVQMGTQRWVTSFERHFRQYPSDWVFMLDKRWARVLAAASEANRVRSAAPAPAGWREVPAPADITNQPDPN